MRLCSSLFAAALAIVGAEPAHAQWTGGQKEIYRSACVKSCTEADASLAARCQIMCACSTNDVSAAWPNPKRFTDLMEANDRATMERFMAIQQSCAARSP